MVGWHWPEPSDSSKRVKRMILADRGATNRCTLPHVAQRLTMGHRPRGGALLRISACVEDGSGVSCRVILPDIPF
jgi:hypothetical protein